MNRAEAKPPDKLPARCPHCGSRDGVRTHVEFGWWCMNCGSKGPRKT